MLLGWDDFAGALNICESAILALEGWCRYMLTALASRAAKVAPKRGPMTGI
jgi:hypothetical protein